MSISNNEQKTNFGANQGVWEYYDHDNKLIAYVSRHKKQDEGKKFIPWSFVNNKWVKKWEGPKPIYRVRDLVMNPDKPVMMVEGEKTADYASSMLPEYVVVSWMGGSAGAKHIDTTHFQGRDVYIWPDNDKPGFKAQESLKEVLKDVAKNVYCINPKPLKLPAKWDLANFTDEHCEIDLDMVLITIEDAKNSKEEFDSLSYPFLSDGNNPRPLDLTENLKHILKHYNIRFRWNMMKREWDVEVPSKTFYSEEKENEVLTYITNLAVLHGFNIRRVAKHLDAIALENIYHPVRDWVLSKPLKDHSHFDKFLKLLKTADDEFSHLLLKRWLISAIGVLFNEDNFIAQGVLVLHGPGGWCKSTFIAMLAPPELEAIKKGTELDTSNKDNLIRLARYWIAELGELGGTINKSDHNKLKAHITQDLDEARRPFAAKDSKMIRRTIYAGTVNEESFLVDETGNRRWWTISLTEPIDTDAMKLIDMQQVWRAAYELYLGGERPYLNNDEVARLNESNEKHEQIDPLDEKLDAYFNWKQPGNHWMNSTQILEVIGYKNPNKTQTTRISFFLKKRGLEKGTGRLKRCYWMPYYNHKPERISV